MSYDGNHTYSKRSNELQKSTSLLVDYGIYAQSRCVSSTKRVSHRSLTTRLLSGMTHSEIRHTFGTYAPYSGLRSSAFYRHFERWPQLRWM